MKTLRISYSCPNEAPKQTKRSMAINSKPFMLFRFQIFLLASLNLESVLIMISEVCGGRRFGRSSRQLITGIKCSPRQGLVF